MAMASAVKSKRKLELLLRLQGTENKMKNVPQHWHGQNFLIKRPIQFVFQNPAVNSSYEDTYLSDVNEIHTI